MKSLHELSYPKQYIINENDGKKIYKSLTTDENMQPVDEYLWAVVFVISERIVDGITYSLIQYDDERLGWINFEDSIQVLRFPQRSYRFIDQEINAADINEKMGLTKDFRTHFQNKLVTVKSEITYEGERLLGTFVNKKFSGFHPADCFENMVDCNLPIEEKMLSSKDLYKYSSLKNPIKEKIKIDKPKLVHFFKKNNLARVKVNQKEFFWTSLDGLEEIIDEALDNTEEEKSTEQKYMDDILYAIDLERQQSEEIVKTVLAAKKHIATKKEKQKDIKMSHLRSSFLNAKEKNQKLERQIESLKTSNQNEAKHSKELELAEKRLNQQRDYNNRLEKQKEKYKNRMTTVEEKMKKLDTQKN